MTDPVVLVARRGPARWLTINRPERRNALSGDVLAGLVEGLRVDDDARVVVLTGAGDRVFCAGADLAAGAAESTGLEQHEARGGLLTLFAAMAGCPLPVIARVNGLCLAGGVGVLLAADLAVAEESVEIGLPEVGIGLWPFMVSALLARHVSPKRALDLCMTGRRLPAAEAADWGLLSRVAPAGQLDATVEALCDELATKSPLTLRVGKQSWYAAAAGPSLDLALGHLQAQLSLLAQSKDAVEGVTAFFEKRPPEWTGR